ncbi:MAG: zinc-dependent peptidase [Leptolyngbya sp. BL-A-14]
MVQTILFLCGLAIVIGLILAAPFLSKLRRHRICNRPFPHQWQAILDRNVPLYRSLPEPLQMRLRGYVQIFLAEKKFVGCGGLSITEAMKVTIAANACLLLLNQNDRFYPNLNAIYVYPTAFFVNTRESLGGFVVEEKTVGRRGESWDRGLVVLSWADIQYDATRVHDGNNVILHEFAHQLDQEDGAADGVPFLGRGIDRTTWSRVFRQAYEQLQRDVQRGAKTVLDAYGATNPAEFFAVATETFFEKASLMQRYHSELYDVLCLYYSLDPARWSQP